VESADPAAIAELVTEPGSSEALRTGGHGNVDTYDYIVVGSGPGGAPIACNLAKANHTVLLLEAGDDQSDEITTQILALTQLKQTTRWDFFVKHYADEQQTLRHNYLTWRRADGSLWVGPGATAPSNAQLLGVHYPRGATLGGSSVINVAAAWLPNDSEWDEIASLTGDNSWR
jgi:choline dehydrogenase